MIRFLIAAVLAVVTPTAFAGDVTLEPEIVSDPIAQSPGAFHPSVGVPELALAKDRVGVGLVWVAPDAGFHSRVYFVHLDASNHADCAPQQLPVLSDAANAGLPSITADLVRDGFIVSWLEWLPTLPFIVPDVVIAHLSVDGTASGVTKVAHLAAGAATTIRSDFEMGTWLTAGPYLFRIGADGTSAEDAIQLARPGGDIAFADRRPQVVSVGVHQAGDPSSFVCPGTPCGPHVLCNLCCSAQYQPDLDLFSFEISYVSAPLLNRRYEVTATCGGLKPPQSIASSGVAVATNGRALLIVWAEPPQNGISRIILISVDLPATSATFSNAVSNAAVIAQTNVFEQMPRPSIATDGIRHVIVWETSNGPSDHDIVGTVIEHNGSMTPLTIASSGADEREPVITAIGAGGFLVAYDKSSPGERRIAGRTITFPVRRRAAR